MSIPLTLLKHRITYYKISNFYLGNITLSSGNRSRGVVGDEKKIRRRAMTLGAEGINENGIGSSSLNTAGYL